MTPKIPISATPSCPHSLTVWKKGQKFLLPCRVHGPHEQHMTITQEYWK